MRTATVLVTLALLFSTNGCGSSSGGASPTGAAGSLGAAGSSAAGAGGDTGTAGAGTAGAGDGAAGSGAAGVGDAGLDEATGSADADGGAGGTAGELAACGTSTSPSVGESCNTVDATGPCVTAVLGTGTPPSPAGGAIAAGIYDLTSEIVYPTGDAGVELGEESRREVLAASSVTNTTLTVQMTQASGTTVVRQSGPVAISGAQVSFTPTCPPPGDAGDNGGSAGFTATATTFTLFDGGDNGALRVSLYKKR